MEGWVHPDIGALGLGGIVDLDGREGIEQIEEERIYHLEGMGRGQHVHVGILHRLADEVHRLAGTPGHGGHEKARHIVGCLCQRRAPQVDIFQHEHPAALEAAT